MRFSLACLLLGALVLPLAGCSDDPPEEKLFDDLPAPSPNKLAGVYQTIVTEAGMTTEIRLQFLDGSIEGALKCTPKNGHAALTVGGKSDMQTDALDGAKGKIAV